MGHSHREELTVERERAILVGVDLPERPLLGAEPLAELAGLAETAGAEVRGEIVQKRQRPDLTTYLGKGKVEELAELVAATDASLVVFDNDLLPAQVKNLEKATKATVLDRTEVILDIFATRARTKQARLQVELAQLEYTRPRLKRMWTHLERHGGGIGTRGPGEKQLETDRRLIDKRIRDLKRELGVIQARKAREVRARSVELRVSLVGYTNAGKSTLMRRLTEADVYVADKLFATLDTRTRQWRIPGWGKVLLSDTVGFIRNLPHQLVESFQATLEEATHADLLLHVVDASNPDARHQIESVDAVLEEIGAKQTPTLLVLNKIDEIEDPVALTLLERHYPRAVAVSARKGQGIDELQAAVIDIFEDRFVTAEIDSHAGNGRLLSYLEAHGNVFDKRYEDERVAVRVRIARHLLERIEESEGKEISLRVLGPALVPLELGVEGESGSNGEPPGPTGP